MAARARTRAAWFRKLFDTTTRGLLEIDKEASNIDPKLPPEEKGIARTATMGGGMAKQDIVVPNEDVDDTRT